MIAMKRESLDAMSLQDHCVSCLKTCQVTRRLRLISTITRGTAVNRPRKQKQKVTLSHTQARENKALEIVTVYWRYALKFGKSSAYKNKLKRSTAIETFSERTQIN